MSTITTPPSLEIKKLDGPIPVANINLMPFHVDYTGPAPLATYFRPKPAPPRTSSFPSTTEDATPTVTSGLENLAVSASDTDEVPDVMDIDAHAGESQASSVVPPTPSTSASTPVDTPFDSLHDDEADSAGLLIASFRGRTIQGRPIALPAGYGGLVLKAPEDADAGTSTDDTEVKTAPAKGKATSKVAEEKKAAAAAAKERRAARRAGKGRTIVIETEPESEAVEEAQREEHGLTIGAESHEMKVVDPVTDEDTTSVAKSRVLLPTGTFSSFVLWNPDIPVDEGKDEYLRTLTEWVTLAAEIHRA